jgi:nicotinate-nucleotide pyrophosphorylase (carboxylating)
LKARMSNKLVDELIELALKEDLGDGDHTSMACIPADAIGTAQLLVKDEGILCGIAVARKIFVSLEREIRFEQLMNDGDKIKFGDIAFTVRGKVRTLLRAERLVLNIMQHMSGVATQTNEYVRRLSGLKTRVLDTRKTTPGMRMLDKEAVKTGGGENHRTGLFDMILIKDNHIDFAGGIHQALNRTETYLRQARKKLKVVIEARNLDDVKIILENGKADRIMLDNFSLEDTRNAVELIGVSCEIESSGGITLENIRSYAECGVDFISVGALTHQIRSLDLSLKAVDY